MIMNFFNNEMIHPEYVLAEKTVAEKLTNVIEKVLFAKFRAELDIQAYSGSSS